MSQPKAQKSQGKTVDLRGKFRPVPADSLVAEDHGIAFGPALNRTGQQLGDRLFDQRAVCPPLHMSKAPDRRYTQGVAPVDFLDHHILPLPITGQIASVLHGVTY